MGKFSSNSGQNVQVSGSVATTLVASTALRQRASPLLMSASSSFIGNGQNFHLGRLGPKSMIGPNKSHSAIGMLSSSNNLRWDSNNVEDAMSTICVVVWYKHLKILIFYLIYHVVGLSLTRNIYSDLIIDQIITNMLLRLDSANQIQNKWKRAMSSWGMVTVPAWGDFLTYYK